MNSNEYGNIPEKGQAGHAEFVNDIDYNGKRVNMLWYWEEGDITHACSWDATAMKNHYLMVQISDMIKQLYEWFYLRKKGIRKRQKDISSDLLKSFGWQGGIRP